MEIRSRTILMVDDEAQVRDISQRILEKNGYNVLTAQNGVEAMLLGKHHAGPILALITDIHMPPYMGGYELALGIRGMRPGMAVLYISGYAADPLVDAEVKAGSAGFLAKPFSAETLAGALKRRLDLAGPAIPAKAPKSGEGAMLVLVPDGELRDGVTALLRREGREALEARSIGEALQICTWHTGPIGSLLADRDTLARLPAELSERLVQMRPEMRIHRASASGGDGEPKHSGARRLLEEWGVEAAGED